MTFITNYKGVKIYFSTGKNDFYCDVVNNSERYKDKTFSSKKIESIKKAIENYKLGELQDDIYLYVLCKYPPRIEKIKVLRKVGDRLFFSNGKNSQNYNKIRVLKFIIPSL